MEKEDQKTEVTNWHFADGYGSKWVDPPTKMKNSKTKICLEII